ncbi:MAG: flagellar protein FlaG [Chromatiaceae bacterium]|jgi:flagellar protein FlaG|nr:flagellar protein FlaG [Chromatiaceae bacterium]
MANDIGMIKSVLPLGAQNGPGAPSGRVESEFQAKGDPKSVRETGKQAESLDSMVSDLNSLVRELHRELRFSIDQDSGDTVIKVVDRETEEVVRQIPSEELMRLRKRLQEAAGVIFQDSA